MVGKIIQTLLFLLLVTAYCSCRNRTKFLYKQNSTSNAIIYNRVYLTKNYLTEHDFSFSPPKLIDSTLSYIGFIFFENGTFRNISIRPEALNERLLTEYFNKMENEKDQWGVFQLNRDSLYLRGWVAYWGHPLFEAIGRVINKDSIVIYKSRFYNPRRFGIKSAWEYHKDSYSSYPINVSADSTFEFIKPISEKKGK